MDTNELIDYWQDKAKHYKRKCEWQWFYNLLWFIIGFITCYLLARIL